MAVPPEADARRRRAAVEPGVDLLHFDALRWLEQVSQAEREPGRDRHRGAGRSRSARRGRERRPPAPPIDAGQGGVVVEVVQLDACNLPAAPIDNGAPGVREQR